MDAILAKLKDAGLAVYNSPKVRTALKGLLLISAGVAAESLGLSQLLAGLIQ